MSTSNCKLCNEDMENEASISLRVQETYVSFM